MSSKENPRVAKLTIAVPVPRAMPFKIRYPIHLPVEVCAFNVERRPNPTDPIVAAAKNQGK